MLKVVFDHKAAKDWEIIRSKYDDLSKRIIEAYPDETTDEFPRGETKGTFIAARVSSKLKKLRQLHLRYLLERFHLVLPVPNGAIPSAEPKDYG